MFVMFLDKADPFDKEKQTIEALLSQWTEEEVPESELSYAKPQQELPCFNSTVIEATSQIFQPVTAVPVTNAFKPLDSETVIVELGAPNANVASNVVAQNVADMPGNVGNMLGNIGNMSGNVGNMPANAENLPEILDLTSEVQSGQDVIMEECHVDAHGEMSKDGQYLPVEGGYILVDGTVVHGKVHSLV